MNEQMCMLGFGLSLEEKERKAILSFQHYERAALRNDPANGFYLCNSAGKDSGVIKHIAKKAGVRFVAHHSLTTIDPPELIYHLKKHHSDTIIHRPEHPLLWSLVHLKGQGPPTRLSRWCCEMYKESGGAGKVKVFGVRAAESQKRKANWKVWQPSINGNDGWILNPILYWTDEDIWRYTRQEGIPYCSLYDEGFERLGCVGCPMAGDKRKMEFARWPRYEAAWKKAFREFWARWHGVPRERSVWVSMEGKWLFKPIAGEPVSSQWVEKRKRVEQGFTTYRRWYDLREFKDDKELWKWWMEELPEPDESDPCQMGLF